MDKNNEAFPAGWACQQNKFTPKARKISQFLALLFSTLLLASCGSSDDDDNPSPVTGLFVDDLVEGLVYFCSSGNFFETNANGEFTCNSNETVTFYLGTNQFGPVPATTAIVTPMTLFPNDLQSAINFARLLQSVDTDGDPDNGVIAADRTLISNLPSNIDFSSPTFTSDLEGAVAGLTLVTAGEAEQNLNDAIAQYANQFPSGSTAPVADAGGNRSITTGATITLNGSGSSDADGDTLTYSWGLVSKPAGSSAVLVNPFNIETSLEINMDGDYVITLFVFDGALVSTDTITITATTAIPTMPQGLQATAGDSEVALSWNAGVNVSSYTVYWNTTGSVTKSDNMLDPGSSIQISHSGLNNSTTYYYRVSATNSAGEGLLSSEVSATPTAAVTIPAAPQNVQASAGDSEVTLLWSASSGATSYTVYWNTTGSVTTSDASFSASSTQVTHTGRTNGTTYYYRVTATNTAGEGELSTETTATPTATVTVPTAPQGVQGSAGDTVVSLSWSTVSGANSYTVYWNTTGSVSTSDASIDAGSITTYTHTSLTNDTTHYYRVSATNTAGESTLSSEVSATPTAPATEVPGIPTGLNATAGDAQVALSWETVTGATFYTVYWRTTGNAESGSFDAGSNTQYTHTGVTNGTTYYYQVSASNSAGEGSSTSTVSATPVIPVPLALRATAGSGQTDLTWTAVSETGSYNYTVYWNTSGNVTTSDSSIDAGNNTQIAHGGLSGGVTYYYRVSASGAAGEGGLSGQAMSTQPPGWQWVNPLPQGNSIEDIVWDGSQYVAVTSGGTVLTSDDGANWTIRNTGDSGYISGIEWTGSLFVAASDSGAVLSSPDAITWTSQMLTNGAGLIDVAWNGELYVIVGLSGIIFTSPDAITWTQRTSNFPSLSGALSKVIWANNQFVTTGVAVLGKLVGVIITSPDGITWTNQASGYDGNLGDIAWDGSQYLVTAGQTVLTSQDGATWTTQSVSPTNLAVGSLIWDGTQYVATGQGGLIATSVNGVDWVDQNSGYTDTFRSIIWNGSQYVVGSLSGGLFTSSNLSTWTKHSSDITTESFEDIVWGGGQFVAVGRAGMIMTSPDGESWTIQTTPDTGNPYWLNDVSWNSSLSQYMAVGSYSTILTSPDGVTWTNQNSGTSLKTFSGIAWDDSKYVVVGNPGMILTSPDGQIWTTRNDGATDTINESLQTVVWDGGQFVVVGRNGPATIGLILTSLDGITWTENTTIFSRLDDVAWSGSLFVATGAIGWTATSIDGLTWTKNYIGTSGYMQHVEWDGSQFVSSIVGIIYTSTDGVNWQTQSSGSGTSIYSIDWNDSGKAVAVGLNGSILTNASW